MTVDNLLYLANHERAASLRKQVQDKRDRVYAGYKEADAVKKMILRLTVEGIFKFGTVLCVVEVSTLASIYIFKLIIDLLADPSAFSLEYRVGLFLGFCLARLITIFARSWYDLHVYNYYRFVQTQIQCWLFELVCSLRQWQVKEEKKAQVVNILTKDIEIFVTGSWQFPYLLTVPINTALSATFLFSMFGYIVVVCYVAMGVLLVMQYYTNACIARLQYAALTTADKRIQLIAQILKGIKTIKCRVLEQLYSSRVNEVRARELAAFSRYCDIKNVCAAIYFNAGVIISALVFLLADKSTLELGKVFSTLALLGYIFNFSILYSNYAIESLYSLSVFNKRIEDVVTKHLTEDQQAPRNIFEAGDGPGAPCLAFEGVTAGWAQAEQEASFVTGERMHSDGDENAVIRDLTFSFESGKKVAVIGPVGSGKTSLLMSILGEMPVSQGRVLLQKDAQIAYAEQEPLIVTGTVESNILFGLRMDREWYDRVCQACCLADDFS